MSPKELLYIEDALSQQAFFKNQVNEISSQLQDQELKSFVSTLLKEHNAIFKKFYGVL